MKPKIGDLVMIINPNRDHYWTRGEIMQVYGTEPGPDSYVVVKFPTEEWINYNWCEINIKDESWVV